MLRTLHIGHYVLIDSLDVSFPEGLIIITGQTGAGKSILLGALSLLSGGKADASVISSGAESCVVEAEFDADDASGIRDLLEDSDCEWDGGHLIVRRTLSRSGRSRAFINDSPVSLQLLSSVCSRLVDIHSQHQSLLLADHRYQLSILDRFAGNGELISSCRKQWGELKNCREALEKAVAQKNRSEEERGYVEARLKQLEAASIDDPGELEALEEEQKTLSHVEEIKLQLNHIENCFDSSESSGISTLLKDVSKSLSRLSSLMPSMGELSERVESSRIELEDISESVSSVNSRLDCSPERLSRVEDRLSLLYALLRQYGCTTLQELSSVRDSFARSLSETEEAEDRILELTARIRSLETGFLELCKSLHNTRGEAAVRFSEAINLSLASLELEHSLFTVDVVPAEAGPDGADSVVFRFSSTGKDPVDVARCASGGELSRIMLCLKSMMARYAGMPTLVFDEIDTGVSGSVADKMGRMICEMGESMQVLAITHLPQVAAKGNAHYVVTKTIDAAGNAISDIHSVEGEDRVNELARLLSGSVMTPEAVANARALIDNRD